MSYLGEPSVMLKNRALSHISVVFNGSNNFNMHICVKEFITGMGFFFNLNNKVH